MPTDKRYVWQIASFCAFLVLTIQALALRNLKESGFEPGFSLLLLGILLSTGLYLLIFRALVSLFRFKIWKRLNGRFDVAGKWEMDLVSGEGNSNRRKGRLRVLQEAEEIRIIGENWEEGQNGDLRSIWRSSAVWIDGLTLSFSYVVDRTSGEPTSKKGLAILNLDGDSPPSELLGAYYDLSPSPSKGEMRWQRRDS